MKTDKAPRKGRRVWRSILLGVPLVIVLYIASINAFFITPKESYWIDDETFGTTRYLHFVSGKDGWSESLPIDPPQSVPGSYRLAIVELDEFGDFYQSERDPARPEDYQLSCAREMLRSGSAADCKPVLFFLLVHGWRQNASKEDESLAAFKQLLGHLARSEWVSRSFSVCGVYVGWRGASVRPCGWFTLPAEILSFWQRKSVAEMIAGTSTSTAIFGLIDTARRAAPDPESEPSRIVLAGHSLGAGILMNSVSQALAYQYAQATSARSNPDEAVTLDSPADLILLLNPAVESVYLRQLRESMQPVNWKGYPWLVSLSSETDRVTKYLFPLAHRWRFASDARKPPYFEIDWTNYHEPDSADAQEADGVARKLGPVSQSVYATETPGHNSYMRDLHVAVRRNGAEELAKLNQDFPAFEDVIAYNMARGKTHYFLLKSKEGPPWFGYFDNMRPKAEIHPLFWVATVDRMIMDGHGMPFDDGVRRDNFIGTVMAIMADSSVQHDHVASKAEIKPTQAKY